MPTPTNVLTEAFERTARMDIHDVARDLINNLGPTLVAVMADVRDKKLPYKWAKSDGVKPRPAAVQRLQTAHRAWSMLTTTNDDFIARAWFIGLNPRLNEQEPAIAIREGRLQEALAAAEAFAEGSSNA